MLKHNVDYQRTRRRIGGKRATYRRIRRRDRNLRLSGPFHAHRGGINLGYQEMLKGYGDVTNVSFKFC